MGLCGDSFFVILLQPLKQRLQSCVAWARSVVLVHTALTVVDEEEGDAVYVERLSERALSVDEQVALKSELCHLLLPCLNIRVDRD